MPNTYQVKLIQKGNSQTITLPEELSISTEEVTIRKEVGEDNICT